MSDLKVTKTFGNLNRCISVVYNNMIKHYTKLEKNNNSIDKCSHSLNASIELFKKIEKNLANVDKQADNNIF